MKQTEYIPSVQTIRGFFRLLRFGTPSGDDISVTRIEDQPSNKITEVPLFRSGIYRIILLLGAEVEWHLPNQRLQASNNCLYLSQPGALESWRASPNNKGFVVCFTKALLQGYHNNQSAGQVPPFKHFEGSSILYLTDVEAERIIQTGIAMLQEATTYQPERHLMLKYLLFQYLLEIQRIYLQSIDELPQQVKNDTSIYYRFKKALDQHFASLANGQVTTQVSVSTLASQLALTPAYMGTVVKELTGKTAVGHINDKTVLEAKSYLLNTSLQVAEIAHRLGFSNASYFTRFFKKQTGTTPKSYKQAQGFL